MSSLKCANQFFREGHYSDALSLYEEIAKTDPALRSLVLPNIRSARRKLKEGGIAEQSPSVLNQNKSAHPANLPRTEPLLTILCLTYNHEPFIAQALDGFLGQKTNFPIEILIGDDASTDNTAEIVEQYVKLHPKRIRFIKRPTNVGVKENGLDLRRRVRGKYLALCEGDDYWTDPTKLQQQVEFLEANPDYAVCFHPVIVRDENDSEKRSLFPTDLEEGEVPLSRLLKSNCIQTNSVVYRWGFKEAEDHDVLTQEFQPRDWFNHILHARLGKIHYIDRVMGVYRRHSGGMWSPFDTHTKRMRKWGLLHINFFRILNKKFNGKFEADFKSRMLSMYRDIYLDAFERADTRTLSELKYKCADIEAAANVSLGFMDLKENHRRDKPSPKEPMITVTTIIATFNHKQYIAQCLESVVSQRGAFHHHIVIADDCSDDGTAEEVRNFIAGLRGSSSRSFDLIFQQENIGLLGNLKLALSHAKGQFIAFCEGDDYWLSDLKLAKQIGALLRDRSLMFCFNWILLQLPNESYRPHSEQHQFPSGSVRFEDLLPVDLPANFSCCVYRASAVRLVPDEYYSQVGAADWLFHLFVLNKGRGFFLKEILSVYRLHDRGLWSALSTREKNLRIRNSYSKFMELFPDRKEAILPFMQKFTGVDLPDQLHEEDWRKSQKGAAKDICIDKRIIRSGYLSIEGWEWPSGNLEEVCLGRYLVLADADRVMKCSFRVSKIGRPDVLKSFRANPSVKRAIDASSIGFGGLIPLDGLHLDQYLYLVSIRSKRILEYPMGSLNSLHKTIGGGVYVR